MSGAVSTETWMQIVPVALPETVESYHCCQSEGEELYQRFLMSTDICTHSVLLHPVCPDRGRSAQEQTLVHSWHP